MHHPNWDIEEICYDSNHIEAVLSEIKANFPQYFDKFLETEAGARVTKEDFAAAGGLFRVAKITEAKKNSDKGVLFTRIIDEAIRGFESDRPSYHKILDLEALEEYEDDPRNFKNSVLRNACPIIRQTLQNREMKELDKYRAEFNNADPKELLSVTKNLTVFAVQYLKGSYDEKTYDRFSNIEEMGLAALDEDEYSVYGVIGGGIKSHFLYKFNPSVFPNRSRESIWALWYLTSKKTFNCKQDSEFLMLDVEKSRTQQNYFYPYRLFAFYAHKIYLLLKIEAEKSNVAISQCYTYVIVDSFLSFVATEHQEEIEELSRVSSDEDYRGYGS